MLAFVHINKAAGTNVSQILRRSYGPAHCDVKTWREGAAFYSARDHRRVQALHPRLRSIAGHHVRPWSDLRDCRPDLFYFAFLREPLSRCASNYQQTLRAGRGRPFEEWIRNPRWHNRQTRHLGGTEKVDDALRVIEREGVLLGLVSRFDEGLVMLRLRRRDPRLDIRYEPSNVAPDSTIARRLLEEPASRRALEEANRADLALYEQVVEELYPRQRREFPGLETEVEAFQRENREKVGLGLGHALNLAQRNLVYKPALRLVRALSRPGAPGSPVPDRDRPAATEEDPGPS